MSAYIILFIALLLIFIEFYMPGAIFGTAGALLMITSIIVFARQMQSPVELIIFIAIALGGLAFVITFALKRIRKTAGDQTLFLDSDQADYHAAKYDESLIEKKGLALSDLKPSGHIRIEGKRYQAVSQSGYVTEGTKIQIIGGQGAYLIVKPLKEDKKS